MNPEDCRAERLNLELAYNRAELSRIGDSLDSIAQSLRIQTLMAIVRDAQKTGAAHLLPDGMILELESLTGLKVNR